MAYEQAARYRPLFLLSATRLWMRHCSGDPLNRQAKVFFFLSRSAIVDARSFRRRRMQLIENPDLFMFGI